ncbi:MAG: CDP-alcohol phosphatidyltransferase family protein [Deltaproteobacteria bacterium]|nr:CDP-alcohol phosphatidyltransferase family protein [Deltaproteobacteria bacterium]
MSNLSAPGTEDAADSSADHSEGRSEGGVAAAEVAPIVVPVDELPWKARVEEPTNRYVYYPLARLLTRLLVKTPISANQVTLIQPFFAALAGYLIMHEDWRYLVLGALAFELRSLLDCTDGTLARAKQTASSGGHALDALCDWLCVVFLYVGVYFHFRFHPPPDGVWSACLPMGAVIAISLAQGALRSAAHDYFMRKFGSLLAKGRDETVEDLRDKQRALKPDSPITDKAEAWIGRSQHMLIQHERFDVRRTKSIAGRQAQLFIDQRHRPLMRILARLWSISGGDFYVRLTVLSVIAGHYWMWELQLFMASIGFLWIIALVWLSSWFIRRTTEAVGSDPAEIEA